MKVILSAYACRPGAGSEGGHGWNYATGLARRGHEVHAFVPARCREGVDSALRADPIPGLTFHYVPDRRWPLRLGWTAGSALRYVLWQWDAAAAARRLEAARGCDVAHHVSFGSLLGGSFLWRLRAPLVFGPVGGGQTAPPAFLSYFGRFRRAEVLRTAVTTRLWPLDWLARQTVRRAAVVLAGNRETAALARRLGARRVEPMLSVYLPDAVVPSGYAARPRRDVLRVLWVGRYLGRKGQQLAVEALDLVPKSCEVELIMIGDGPAGAGFRRWLQDTRRQHTVTLSGELPWQDVLAAYDEADVFLFTSLRDTVGVQVLEAMAHGLPVVTLDHQGVAELVTAETGIKVPVTSVAATRRALATALTRLAQDPDLRAGMGAAGLRRARRLTLSLRLDRIERLYAWAVGDGLRTLDPADYERLNVQQPGSEVDGFTSERYAQFTRFLPARRLHVLDLGCNVGRGGVVVKRLRPDVSLTGLDVVTARLQKVPAGVYDRAVAGTATNLPFGDERFDAVLAGEVIEHLTDCDVDLMLEEVRRVLRPGGLLLLTTPNPQGINYRAKRASVLDERSHLSQHTPRQLRARLRRHGLRVAAIKGTGRMMRRVGESVRPLCLYGSYLVVARVSSARR